MGLSVNNINSNAGYAYKNTLQNQAKIENKASETKVTTIIDELILTSDQENIEKTAEKTPLEQTSSENREQPSNKGQMDMATFNRELANAKKSAEGMKSTYEAMRLAQEICRRMTKGATVSGSDEQFLMNYSHKMYQMAKNAQMMAKSKEDYSDESLSEELEEGNSEDTNEEEGITANSTKLPETSSAETPTAEPQSIDVTA